MSNLTDTLGQMVNETREAIFCPGSLQILLQLNLALSEISGILSVVSYTADFPYDAAVTPAQLLNKGTY